MAKNITGTILIEVVEHTEIMIGEERYMLEECSAMLPHSIKERGNRKRKAL